MKTIIFLHALAFATIISNAQTPRPLLGQLLKANGSSIKTKTFVGGVYLITPARPPVIAKDSLSVVWIDTHSSVVAYVEEFQSSYVLWSDTTNPTYKGIGNWTEGQAIIRLKQLLPKY